MDETPPQPQENTSYTILVWKYGPTIENRHIKRYSNKKFDPFEHCSVRNCKITYEEKNLKNADLVIFHLHRTKGVSDLPAGPRNSKQIWAFLTDESPQHTFYNQKTQLKEFDGVFNWSMTYRYVKKTAKSIRITRPVFFPEWIQTSQCLTDAQLL